MNLVVFLLVFGAHFADAQTLPDNLMAPCDQTLRQSQVQELRDAAGPKVPQACIDAVKEALKSCIELQAMSDGDQQQLAVDLTGGGSVGKDAFATGMGTPEMAQAQIRGLKFGSARYRAHGQTCDAQKANVHAKCEEMRKALRTAQSNNHKAMEQEQAMAATNPGLAASIQRHVEVNVDLTEQISQTNNTIEKSDQLFGTAASCSNNQATIYDSDAARSQLTFEQSKQANPGGGTTEKTAALPLTDRVKKDGLTNPAAAVTWDKASGLATAPIAKTVAKAIPGPIGTLVGAVSGNAVGNYAGNQVNAPSDTLAGYTGMAETGMSMVAPRATAALGGPIAAVPLVLHSTPVSACGDVYTDPVAAYQNQCSLRTFAGASNNEQAIQFLEQK